ncbi:MAG: zinc-dependent peptidase [Crocinitomicaceae bacterium]|nr:zinc-dependent peptidase [Crocinitomicaceae bacterium]
MDEQQLIILIVAGIMLGIVFVYFKSKYGKISSPLRKPDRDFPYQWRSILEQKVEFYKKLNREERKLFEYKVHVFLLNVRIVGIQTQVSHDDQVLIAASAIIPIFRFKQWHYSGLREVHLHPDKFPIPNSDHMAHGLVGWGEMHGKVMLSRKALHHGFEDHTDGKNVGIHEFLHLLDKGDGEVDGVLETLMKENDIEPWLYLIKTKMDEINLGDSDIREYGGVNEAEFLAVVGEYFFEKPDAMKTEHPALYNALDSFFNPPKELIEQYKYTSKYDPCPCGSGKKYDDCCLKNSESY